MASSQTLTVVWATLFVVMVCILIPGTYAFATAGFRWTDLYYTAQIDAGQLLLEDDDDAVGSIVDDDEDHMITSPNNGNAVCQYMINQVPPVLSCTIVHSSTFATSVELHRGVRKTNGVYIGELISTNGAQEVLPQLLDFDFTIPATPTTVEDDLMNGRLYILFRSPLFPQGELRGQLERRHRLYSILVPEEVTPAPALLSNNIGLLLANYTALSNNNPDVLNRSMTVNIVHTIQRDFTTARMYQGRFAEPAGENIWEFRSARSPIRETANFTVTQETDLFVERYFFQVASNSYPNGELRGQFIAIEPIPIISHTGRMDHTQPVPPYQPLYNELPRGCILVTYDCLSGVLEYLVVHNVEFADRATGNFGARFSSGVKIFDLARAKSPIYGRTTIGTDGRLALINQELYFEIFQPGQSTATIRGQIEKKYEYYAYLSGSQMVPPITTSAVGCGTFSLLPNRVVDYDINHHVKKPSEVIIQAGDVGAVAPLTSRVAVFTGIKTPVRGNDFKITIADRDLMLNEKLHVIIRSADYPDGELRGQLIHIRTLTCDTTVPVPPPPFLPPTVPLPPVGPPPNATTTTTGSNNPPGFGDGSMLTPSVWLVCMTFVACAYSLATMAF